LQRPIRSMARHDAAALPAGHSPDSVVDSPTLATLRGRAALEDSYRALFHSFPDWKMTPNAILIDPPHIAVFSTINATHVNEFFGLPGTHRHVEIQSARYLTVETGFITRERRIYDFTGMLVQVGV